MSISFFIKNLKNKESITIEKVLEIGETISQYTLDEADENIEKFLNEKLENFECILLGEEEKSARGFELSYNKENKYYGIRVFTPCSIGDWEVVFDFIEKLGKFLENNKIVNEHGEDYTLETIRTYPYIEDIEYGIQSIEDNLKEKGSEISKIYGIYRPISFNNELLNDIKNSKNSVETFSKIITEIQYIDAFSANQRFYKNNNEEIFGAYTLTESVRTILPFKPSVEYENFDIVKNEDVKFWRLIFVIINGNPDDENSYEMLGDIDYTKFIQNLSKDKYSFIDGEYILVEPLEKNEIEKLYKLLGE
ncbi:MAG: DUF4299 domain-containing protein [Fusobacterium perfoetens]|uniref:DUF4299 family protein n=1 Tax=Fusobacterium perfoetens TaxID=852 RepID=UPI0023F5543F|nr:DUF4299 family protein [Fusobacterium perfoetens]MCI6152270.1 DUF4299 domain-containing protein [Fusobacterium perfoetens]MDY3238128.1 DUF4299 family protein [Fusobacterium perfoetens]